MLYPDILRMTLPTIIPPSYRGSTVRYLYHVKSELSGKYLNMDDGHSHGGSSQKLPDIVSLLSSTSIYYWSVFFNLFFFFLKSFSIVYM